MPQGDYEVPLVIFDRGFYTDGEMSLRSFNRACPASTVEPAMINVLHDIFELPYPHIAETLEMKEGACRKLVSSARTSIGQGKSRAEPPPLTRQEALFLAFERAISTGDVSQLALMLAEDVEMRHDTGGKVPATVFTLEGKPRVLDFVERFLHRAWRKYEWRLVDLNGARAVTLRKAGVIVTVVSLGFNESQQACQIQILRNPDELKALNSMR